MILILPRKKRPTFQVTKMQSNEMRIRQRIGTMIARKDVITDPASSPVATKGLPFPAVSADYFVRKATVVP